MDSSIYGIRKATVKDLYYCMLLEQKYFNDNPRMCDELHDRVVPQNNYFYVCFLKKSTQIIGCLKSEKLASDIVHITIIVVEKQFRRRGIAHNLITRLIFDTQCAKLVLYVSASNDCALAFYHNQGFKIVSTINNFFKSGLSAYKMVLEDFNIFLPQ